MENAQARETWLFLGFYKKQVLSNRFNKIYAFLAQSKVEAKKKATKNEKSH